MGGGLVLGSGFGSCGGRIGRFPPLEGVEGLPSGICGGDMELFGIGNIDWACGGEGTEGGGIIEDGLVLTFVSPVSRRLFIISGRSSSGRSRFTPTRGFGMFAFMSDCTSCRRAIDRANIVGSSL